MATTITAGNATNGLAFSADNTGILELKTGTGSGTTAVTISTAQVVTFAGNVSGVIKSGTAVASTSGTSIDFTGIPSTAKRITVMLAGVSTNGTSPFLLQLGDAGGIENTGYVSSSTGFTGTGGSTSSSTAGFVVAYDTAAYIVSGAVTFNYVGANLWVSAGVGKMATNVSFTSGGDKTLSDTLTQIRLTTVGGVNTFDAGTINILWE